jgi:hypothetical protein
MEALGEETGADFGSFLHSAKTYLKYGFLIPRYWVRHMRKGRKERKELDFSTATNFVYNKDWQLQEIQFEWTSTSLDMLAYYREWKLLIEEARTVNPRSKDRSRLTPLFTFSQVAQFRKIHRVLKKGPFNVNFLFFSPEDYRMVREELLPVIKQTLEEIGAPAFCQRATCGKPLENDSRNRYCGDECQKREHEARRQARRLQKGLKVPLTDYTEVPTLPSLP